MATRKFARDFFMCKHLRQPQRLFTSPRMVPSSSNGISAFKREFSVLNECSKMIKGSLERNPAMPQSTNGVKANAGDLNGMEANLNARLASCRYGLVDCNMAKSGTKRVDWGLIKAEAMARQVNGSLPLGIKEPKGTRSYSTSNGEKKNSDASAAVSTPNIRPLSPHLSIYKPQSNSMVSIFFRISGIVLAAACCLFPLIYMKIGFVAFTYQYVYQMFFLLAQLIPIAALIVGLALVYHTIHGIRHFLPNFTKIKV